MKKSMSVLAAVVLVLAVSSGAFAAKGLLTGADIENGSLTGSDIQKRSLGATLFTRSAKKYLRGAAGSRGAQGAVGLAGSNSVGSERRRRHQGTSPASTGSMAPRAGTNGTAGTNGVDGANGVDGTNGLAGVDGTNGVDGANGVDGVERIDGTNGLAGADGTNGSNGTVTPFWATAGLTALPTASPPSVVVALAVPAGTYVVLAKTQLSHTGAGDSIDCWLKAGTTTLDQIAIKACPHLPPYRCHSRPSRRPRRRPR